MKQYQGYRNLAIRVFLGFTPTKFPFPLEDFAFDFEPVIILFDYRTNAAPIKARGLL